MFSLFLFYFVLYFVTVPLAVISSVWKSSATTTLLFVPEYASMLGRL
jgi:hypothetical protein